ncbi:hypothetical protein [Alloalcanivorax xenomutans]|uniref:hypothetical protein n=1 Tax=Alloalcanivorax xenomutans TaxID=1094342 RepID=UPI0006D5B79B|nr:hypothetical protein [Alloalcanivorax xenomutans]CUR48490.1 Phage protein [Alloalcanivorax xenomutans]
MMRPTLRLQGGNKLAQRLRQIRERVERHRGVLVGLPAGSGTEEDGTPLVVIGATHEFGGKIDHPGGTAYGYRTEQDAEDGKVRFLAQGQGYMVLGETPPHEIDIPERSFLRVPLRSKQKEIAKAFRHLLPKVIDGQISELTMLHQIGAYGASVCQEAISAGIDPANAQSTIDRKGSSTPLVDDGTMRQSITYVIEGADRES